jgi:hypothetical protein
VLIFAANPRDQDPLALDEEVREVAEKIRKSEHRDALNLKTRWAVRPDDVLQGLNEDRPQIVHFSAHGSQYDELLLQDNAGGSKPVSKEAVVRALAAAGAGVQLVIFNTCYSVAQAEAVVAHVPAAIGMNDEIEDETARTFSSALYSAIGFGKSLQEAFNQATAAVSMNGLPDADVPELFTAAGLDARDVVLVKARGHGTDE